MLFAGIFEERVIAQGYGDTEPIVENEITEEDKKLNRRVEFEIYREGQVLEEENPQDENDF